jgi:hypothetical protein
VSTKPHVEVTMQSTIDKFRGVKVEVSDLSGDPKEFLVRFTREKLEGGGRLDGKLKPAPHLAIVVVRATPTPEVVGYIPPEFDFPNLGQEDLERRALEEVRTYLPGVRN